MMPSLQVPDNSRPYPGPRIPLLSSVSLHKFYTVKILFIYRQPLGNSGFRGLIQRFEKKLAERDKFFILKYQPERHMCSEG